MYKMGSSRSNIFSFLTPLFLFLSSVCSSPISNPNEYTKIYMEDPSPDIAAFRFSNEYQNDPLIFESGELNWGGGGDRQTRESIIKDYSLKFEDVPTDSQSNAKHLEQDTERIDFRPIRPPSRHKYNRRPSLTKPSNGFSFLQSSPETESPKNADGKSEFFSLLNKDSPKSQIESTTSCPCSSSEVILAPQDVITSDPSSGQEESEEDLLNMFFAHVKSTPVSKHSPPPPENIEVKKYKGKYSSLDKPGKYAYPLDKSGKKKKTKNPQENSIRNVVLHSELDDEDSDELAFLTFDSGIQRRKCPSGTLKDGKCRPPTLIQ